MTHSTSNRGTAAALREALAPLAETTLRPATGRLKHPYLVPGVYDQCWDWDSYFIAVALSGEPDALPHIRGTVENFFAHTRGDGNIPRWLHPDQSFWDSGYLDTDFSRDLAKPFLAQIALVHAEASGDAEWFRPYLEAEKRFLGLWSERRMAPTGLHVWANGMESGCDNHPDIFGWPEFSIEGVDLAVYLVREHFAAAVLAFRCGEYSLFHHFQGRGRFLLHQMRHLLFDEANDTFANRYRPTGQFVDISTQTRFSPFWLGDLCGISQERRKRILRERLWNEATFLSPHGLRSASKDDPVFNNTHGTCPSNVQGPIWLMENFISFCALVQSGMQEEARELADRLQRLLLRDLEARGQMSECYHSETGEPLAVGGFVSWNLLAGHMDEWADAERLPSLIRLPKEGGA